MAGSTLMNLRNTSRYYYLDYVQKYIEQEPEPRILEIGCGEGALLGYNEATRKFTAQDTNLYVSMNRFGGGVAYKSKKALARSERA